jgi:uncharacterized protein (TIGR01777 family)
MNKKILIAGGTGMIGKKLVAELCSQGAYIRILSRDSKKANKYFHEYLTAEAIDIKNYGEPSLLKKITEDTDIVINLAGANVGDKKWTNEYKEEIYNSRIKMTSLIVKSVKLSENKPECLINASGTGIYGFRGDEIINEESSHGGDFLAGVCTDWEKEAYKAAESNVRVVTLRTGIVLDKKEGALSELLMPFRFYTNAYQGNGKQWFPWIHIDDIVKSYIFAATNTAISGAVNAVSPDTVTARQFSDMISKFKKTFITLPVPKFILKIAAGEFAENLVTGQRVIPKKLLRYGFEFKYPNLFNAMEELLL